MPSAGAAVIASRYFAVKIPFSTNVKLELDVFFFYFQNLEVPAIILKQIVRETFQLQNIILILKSFPFWLL